MRKLIIAASAFALAACEGSSSSVREQQAAEAARAAQTLDFSAGNAERDNVVRRGQLVSQPDLVGYVVLISMGQPVAYYTIRGKVTSSGKRLERPQEQICNVSDCGTWDAPSYDGTYGSSDDYIYFWTTGGQYVQWSTGGGNGYLYSDQPLQPNTAAAGALVRTPERPPA